METLNKHTLNYTLTWSDDFRVLLVKLWMEGLREESIREEDVREEGLREEDMREEDVRD